MGVKKNSFFTFDDDSRAFRFVEDVEDTETTEEDEDAPQSMEEFVASLELPFEGEMKGEEYVVPLYNSDEFSDAYNIVSTDKDFIVSKDSIANNDEARFKFISDYFEISLLADFNDDVYRLVVTKA